MLAEEVEDLVRAGGAHGTDVPVGVMIETPAAVVLADRLARVSAFFSIGTNDLTQYTLAVDRGNANLASRFTPHDPAILRMLRDVLAAGTAQGIPVSVCGEMASEPLFAVLLIGLGFTNLPWPRPRCRCSNGWCAPCPPRWRATPRAPRSRPPIRRGHRDPARGARAWWTCV
jgi:phosphoenolpyruvate-protein kinase (PTS system EI component)